MSNYLKYIPKDLARELRGFGMPLELCDFFKCPIDYDTKDVPTLDYERYDRIIIPTYGEVIDYFSDNGMLISISRYYDFANECYGNSYDWSIDCEYTLRNGVTGDADTWIEAANKAILACIDLKLISKTR